MNDNAKIDENGRASLIAITDNIEQNIKLIATDENGYLLVSDISGINTIAIYIASATVPPTPPNVPYSNSSWQPPAGWSKTIPMPNVGQKVYISAGTLNSQNTQISWSTPTEYIPQDQHIPKKDYFSTAGSSFQLSEIPVFDSERIYYFPQIGLGGTLNRTQYTLTGRDLVLNSPLLDGDSIEIDYLYN